MAHICSSCGFEASDKFKFCPMCGSKMTSDDESAQEKYKFCPKCGIKISADTQICQTVALILMEYLEKLLINILIIEVLIKLLIGRHLLLGK